ncbi:MAG: hypothetical protein GY797_36465 [Deltaproteobacteria bacterium]|nr:hypothetical protein [Deltaproteobacteria bacterium]
MRQYRLNTRPPKISFILFIISFLLGSISFAQESLRLGNMSYARYTAKPLIRSFSSSYVEQGAVGASTFFRAVGGVAFKEVAIGEDGLVISALSYDGSRTDGDRLQVTVTYPNRKIVKATTRIYDWQLVPIAHFAASDQEGAMSLFGELDETLKTMESQLLGEGARIINYHPAFDNTLVGLRLFQADVLIFQPNAADLFKRSNGEYILGAGEHSHDVNANTKRFQTVEKWLENESERGNTYISYVIGDFDQKVSFSVSNGKLIMKGLPCWWLWKNPKQMEQDLLVVEAVQTVTAVETYFEKLESEGICIETLGPEYQESLIGANKIIKMFRRNDGNVDALFKRIESYGNDAEILPLPKFSDRLNQKVRELNGINPIVYTTLKNVMHYSAIFRHFKQMDPLGYSIFLRSLKHVKVLPNVETPTIQYGKTH